MPDADPEETREWLESLEAVLKNAGDHRARYVMLSLLERAQERGLDVPSLLTTDYVNSIPPEEEVTFPGDEYVERRIRAYARWNAAMMVQRAQHPEIAAGGHISTYASSASLYEVGFNHFFRGRDHPGGGDQIYFQGHASPGMYARAYLEGRLDEHRLDGFRQELSHAGFGGGLPSYPHPRLMPDFWEFPTVSMGLGPIAAIYQARFNRYLQNRELKDTSQQNVWAYLGDGEMDEPETVGALTLAARENLDNLTFVINCNLQRLDGPVRGNGKIIQEMESLFRGAGWNVIKVIWGREWDPLLAKDQDGALVDLMNVTLDGDYQTYKAESGGYVREHFFGRDERTRSMVEDMTDEQIWGLKRGGHDYQKLYAAYDAATKHTGQPTVILAKTIKGWTLGSHFEARNATHQMKKLTVDDLKLFRDRLYLDVPDSALEDPYEAPYLKLGEDSDEYAYMMERRRELGGGIPRRRVTVGPLSMPDEKTYDVTSRGSGKQPVATTMAFVRLLKDLLKDDELGKRIVPIIPDEARTFGMDSLFPSLKIYSPHGQQYASVDRELFLSYQEAEKGQILHEGISEAGSVASFTAIGSSYATHDLPMIPVYIFYSMFGFQRTGDGLWAVGDQMARGFMLGATAGRTTLNGEGLQHEDGHSVLLASSNPAVVHYDPAFAYEIGHIVRSGLERMYGPGAKDSGMDTSLNGANVFYYLTVYNEPYLQPAEPEDLDVDGLLKGLYRYRPQDGTVGDDSPRAQVLASGVAMPWALEAQERLAAEWNVAADVWSVTSWNELRREALDAEEWNLMNPGEQPRVPYVTEQLGEAPGPVVAVSDFMRAVQDQIAQWVPQEFASLGTDGYGMSDTRAALRRHFKVDAQSIVVNVLTQLAHREEIGWDVVHKALETYQLDDVTATTAEEAGGES
ncbi:MAG TPA: pyruvate dehydrogenase (acetyl-transferring), homodimeric type [Jiangellaceae bacterium]|nr:pyruvate dehydrogenase (acetyl-transferring), homodimeric type [Jiangellaceae bacterium]